jgi:drug/metabolite transporter (DMT)-like permease
VPFDTDSSLPPASAGELQESPLRGILLMLGAMFTFSSTDVMSKLLTADLPPVEIGFLRYAVLAVAILPFLFRAGPRSLRTARPGLQMLRALFMVGTTVLFISSLVVLPVAEATAIGFASPFFATALAIPFLGESIGFRRWAAILWGFLGILVVVRPGSAAFEPAALLPLGSAACWASGLIATRLMKASEPALTMLAYTAGIGLLVLALPLPWFWIAPSPGALILALVMGGLTAVAQWLLILALLRAPASVVAPFVYSQILWASGFGALVFGALPDSRTGIGAAIVIASGLYIFHRESVMARGVAAMRRDDAVPYREARKGFARYAKRVLGVQS